MTPTTHRITGPVDTERAIERLADLTGRGYGVEPAGQCLLVMKPRVDRSRRSIGTARYVTVAGVLEAEEPTAYVLSRFASVA